ncbi:hypothetical protein M406DRAFT_358682 [Cryphonectria parasitica EP155]|uniref:Uncharacterized protein n=1 Tax=Cryphonectria parasitica (strain ATCC 38755 / EP155) TaxID=660469 RepID=A0A9P4XSH8_CRYP1|nr:uncharacterized protein M406DRAFT_358682 [Cryphonectria parasitica EP155]KAF3760017.1 hypothetical protein M406DRAFT_358682 [Cryphonectria parasitica EP155]
MTETTFLLARYRHRPMPLLSCLFLVGFAASFGLGRGLVPSCQDFMRVCADTVRSSLEGESSVHTPEAMATIGCSNSLGMDPLSFAHFQHGTFLVAYRGLVPKELTTGFGSQL